MTDLPTQLKKAKIAAQKAVGTADLAAHKLEAECAAFRAKRRKPVDAAYKRVIEMRVEVTRLELAIAGITPMHTIVTYQSSDWVVRILSRGTTHLVPVTKICLLHKNRMPLPTPYRLSSLTVTNRVLKVNTP